MMHWTVLVLVGQLVSLSAAAVCVDSCLQLHRRCRNGELLSRQSQKLCSDE